MGSDMEAALWSDLASFYNANLRNISGPFDRAYGMDMESYVSVVGMALRTVLDPHMAQSQHLIPSLIQPPITWETSGSRRTSPFWES
jgi:hypothetical protein